MPARLLPSLQATGACVCVSGVFVEMVYGRRKGEKERGRARGVSRVRPLIGALGRPWRACEGGRRREKEEGDQGLACCGRRGASSGVLGRPEVAGGGLQGVATVPGRTVACSGACKHY